MHLNIYKKFKVPENILEKIIKNKEKKVDLLKKSLSIESLKSKIEQNKSYINFKDKINWTWEGLKKKDFLINENHKINEPELLFNRIEDSEIQLQIDKLHKKN